ncbi:Uncharacterised protein [Mycobacteroides abscessus subsp. abscessus]|nr:Uncharacterised protein [Mycobacteroides abscessus subsp. abscessus]
MPPLASLTSEIHTRRMKGGPWPTQCGFTKPGDPRFFAGRTSRLAHQVPAR